MTNMFLKKIGSFFTDLMETMVISLSIFLVVYLFFMQPHQVNGQSMEPNFQTGDYLLTDKISYRMGEPERGDIVVFHAPESANCAKGTGCDFIKRILGLPGETVEIRNGVVFINGKVLPEPYIPSDVKTLPGTYSKNGPISLGKDQYFVMGDNRSHSSDSRSWGPIYFTNIVGKAFFRYWPASGVGSLPDVTYSY